MGYPHQEQHGPGNPPYHGSAMDHKVLASTHRLNAVIMGTSWNWILPPQGISWYLPLTVD